MGKFKVFKKESLTLLYDPAQQITHSLIWLHGLGSAPEEFEYFFQHFNILPNTFRIVLPEAPTNSVTINMGMKSTSWFDILSLDSHKPIFNYKDVEKNS